MAKWKIAKWTKVHAVVENPASWKGAVTWQCTEHAGDDVHEGSNVEMVLDIAGEALDLLEELVGEYQSHYSIQGAHITNQVRAFLAKHRAEEKTDISDELVGIRLLSLEANMGRLWARLAEREAAK